MNQLYRTSRNIQLREDLKRILREIELVESDAEELGLNPRLHSRLKTAANFHC